MMNNRPDVSTSQETGKPTTTPDLVQHYRAIATNLDKQQDVLSRLLATDYRFIAELLLVALKRGTVALLVSELRGNLNRRVTYPYCQERNTALQEVANTVERMEVKKP